MLEANDVFERLALHWCRLYTRREVNVRVLERAEHLLLLCLALNRLFNDFFNFYDHIKAHALVELDDT